MANDNSSSWFKNVTLSVQGDSGAGWTTMGEVKGILLGGKQPLPKVKDVKFYDNLVTVVYFDDGDVVRCKVGKNDTFNPEMGYSMCLAKKYMGSYEKFAWSLDKAKYYENGEKVKKSKKVK